MPTVLVRVSVRCDSHRTLQLQFELRGLNARSLHPLFDPRPVSHEGSEASRSSSSTEAGARSFVDGPATVS